MLSHLHKQVCVYNLYTSRYILLVAKLRCGLFPHIFVFLLDSVRSSHFPFFMMSFPFILITKLSHIVFLLFHACALHIYANCPASIISELSLHAVYERLLSVTKLQHICHDSLVISSRPIHWNRQSWLYQTRHVLWESWLLRFCKSISHIRGYRENSGIPPKVLGSAGIGNTVGFTISHSLYERSLLLPTEPDLRPSLFTKRHVGILSLRLAAAAKVR